VSVPVHQVQDTIRARKRHLIMLRTPLCDLLGIDVPIMQASLGPWPAVELVAAVSNAGGLGTIGAVLQSAAQIRQQIARVRELVGGRAFAVNHSLRPLDAEAFAATLAARPAVVSLAHGNPGEFVLRAHDAGARFIHMVNTVRQAREAAARGVDAIIAQGTEAGGFSGTVSTLTLVPQVVDAVSPIPVIAAGGIADGRGLAAALVLGAQGINIGTRFLASAEAGVSDDWKQAIVRAESEDTTKVEFAPDVFPPGPPGGYEGLPRVLPTAYVTEWNARREDAKRHAQRLRGELREALAEGRAHELIPFTGQTAGMIRTVLPAARIIQEIMEETERVLAAAASSTANPRPRLPR
jgi:nitronate monooxygenase/enoyl-[acyl-carrier protein] reductase II